MDLLDIAIAKQLAGGGGGSGTNNYNDLSNQPKINDVTLSGNKTASALGLQNEINSENLLDADLVDDTEADNKFVTSAQMLEWSGKQDKLTFDNVPTSESNNPVKSGGIYIALAGKENSLSANSAAYKDYETTFSANSNDKIPTSKSISDNVADNAKLTNYQAGAGTSFQTIDPTSDKVTDAIEKVQNNALFNKTNILSAESMVCDNAFSTSTAYAEGDIVTYNHKLYKFKTAHSAGAWNSSQVDQISTTGLITPELIELVDSGAKNLAPEATKTITTTGWSVFIQPTSNLPAGNYTVDFDHSVANSAQLQIRYSDSTNQTIEGFIKAAESHFTATFTASKPIENIGIYTNSGTSNFTNIMLCTQAAWNVSHKYVQYRPNWDLVSKLAVPIIIQKEVLIANSLIYTGVTYTLPANNYYRITAYQKYNNNAPATIAIANNQNADPLIDAAIYAITENPYPNNSYLLALSASTIIKTGSTTETLYVFAKARGSTAKNNIIALVIEPLN